MNPLSSSSLSSEDGEYKQEESSEEEEEVVPGTQVQPHQVAMFLQPPPLPALPPMDVMDMSEGNKDATDPADTPINSATTDAVVNPPVSRTATTHELDDEFNLEAAQATQVTRRNTTSSSVARARQSTTPVDTATERKARNKKTGNTNKTKNLTNREQGSVTKSIEKIALSIVDSRSEDLHRYMMMRTMEWNEAEERRRQEREEARRDREEARREREEMEDRHDRRLE